MKLFNFTKTFKYVAGMSGLAYLSNSLSKERQMAIIKEQASSIRKDLDDLDLQYLNNHPKWGVLLRIKEDLTTIDEQSTESSLSVHSLFINLFDNYITQNITDNKLIQYGVIAGISLLFHDRESTFIQSCILKAISDDCENKADNDNCVEVQPEDLSLSTPELLNG